MNDINYFIDNIHRDSGLDSSSIIPHQQQPKPVKQVMEQHQSKYRHAHFDNESLQQPRQLQTAQYSSSQAEAHLQQQPLVQRSPARKYKPPEAQPQPIDPLPELDFSMVNFHEPLDKENFERTKEIEAEYGDDNEIDFNIEIEPPANDIIVLVM